MESIKCQACGKDKRATQFSLDRTGGRQKVCRTCSFDGFTANMKHKILREAYRNYLTFEQFVTDTGKDVIEYAVPERPGSDRYVPVRISFVDLQRALKQYSDGLQAEGTVLSKRKEEAFHLNVLCDMLQRDVAEQMNITMVSVGKYVEQAMRQLCEYYFDGEEDLDTLETSANEE